MRRSVGLAQTRVDPEVERVVVPGADVDALRPEAPSDADALHRRDRVVPGWEGDAVGAGDARPHPVDARGARSSPEDERHLRRRRTRSAGAADGRGRALDDGPMEA